MVKVPPVTVTPRVSSSVIVSVASAGLATPLPPVAVAETVTVLLAASTSLSTAVTVTVPVLSVAPAAMVRVVPLRAKSLLVAGDTAAAATVRVTAWLDALLRVAVTVLELSAPDSAMVVGDSLSVTAGVPSSSVIVPVPVPAPSTVETVALVGVPSVTMIVSLGSSRASPLTLITIVPLVSPAGIAREVDAGVS